MRIITRNEKEFAKVARAFARKLRPDKKNATLVVLSGELGAGKTCFARACARALGVRARIVSPTFVIMKSYPLPLPRGSAPTLVGARGSKTITQYKFFIHIDCYRLKNARELLALGWKKILSDPANLIFLEWPENVLPAGRQVSKILPRRRVKIEIAHTGGRSRCVSVQGV